MAFHTARGIIGNFGMLIIQISLVMAGEAGIGRWSRGVAFGAHAVGTAMVQGEAVVEAGAGPGAGGMAV